MSFAKLEAVPAREQWDQEESLRVALSGLSQADRTGLSCVGMNVARIAGMGSRALACEALF